MSMYNDINSGQNRNEEVWKQTATRLASSAKDFEPSRSFLSPSDEKKVVRELDPQTRRKVQLHAERTPCVQMFRCPSPRSIGVLTCKGGGRFSRHWYRGPEGMLLKTIIPVNQLRIYKAVAKCSNSNSTGDSVNLDENVNILPKLMTNITKREPPDLCYPASRKRECRQSVEEPLQGN